MSGANRQPREPRARRVSWYPAPPRALDQSAERPTVARLTRAWRHLPPLDTAELRGCWRGTAVTTGSLFAVLLKATNWYGKVFRGDDDVDALVFSRPRSVLAVVNYLTIAPCRLPENPDLTRHPLGAARLVSSDRFGARTAAMAYRRLPVVDHFRPLDEDSVLGLMQLGARATPELFFVLERAGETCGARFAP